jgi:ORF6N domain
MFVKIINMSLLKIETKIYEVRGIKVILDFDLAELYEVETKNLNLSVKRNLKRFPADFMFQLSKSEWESLRLQIETSNSRGGTRYLPYVFTEQGLAMLSGILNSDKAIQVNIAIMRAFVFMRQYALSHKDLTEKLKALESQYNQQFKDIYEAIEYLLNKDKKQIAQEERKRMGYKRN